MTSIPAREPAGRDYDPVTKQYLARWERLANIADVSGEVGATTNITGY